MTPRAHTGSSYVWVALPLFGSPPAYVWVAPAASLADVC